jgi:hypothetical protein
MSMIGNLKDLISKAHHPEPYGTIVKLRAHLAGKAFVRKGDGGWPGKGDRTRNHISWGLALAYAGDPDKWREEIVKFYEQQFVVGFDSYFDDEWLSLSHLIQNLGSALVTVAVARMHDGDLNSEEVEVIHVLGCYVRAAFATLRLHRADISPAHKGFPEGVRPVYFFSARIVPWVDEREPIAEALALVDDGVIPSRNLDMADKTVVWVLTLPGMLEWVRAVTLKTDEKDLPPTRTPYRLSLWPGFMQGEFLRPPTQMNAPGMHWRANLKDGTVNVPIPSGWGKLTRYPWPVGQEPPPAPAASPGARVIDWPTIKT